MRDKLLIRLLIFIHSAWGVLIWGGALLVIVVPSYAWWEIGFLSLTIIAGLLFGGHCPFSLWEERLRKRHNPDYEFHNSFTAFALNKMLGTNLTRRDARIILIVAFIISYAISVNALVA